MDKERLIIDKFSNSFIGDDGAVVAHERGRWVYSKDLFCEGTHFLAGWLSMEEIACKAMLVNLSDAVAMNAEPKFALLGLGLPKNTSAAQISALRKGFADVCDEYGVTIIGGDTIGSDKILLSVTVISRLCGKAVLRSGAKKDDLVAFTGELGGSLKGLRTLLNGGRVASNSRFKKPVLKDRFFYAAASKINAAMDVSDGLGADLAKLCAQSRCGAKFSKRLSKRELNSGEEYEILFTFSPKNRAKILSIARKTRTKITIFAKITKGKFKSNARNHHF